MKEIAMMKEMERDNSNPIKMDIISGIRKDCLEGL
jgi:hypothetical protein